MFPTEVNYLEYLEGYPSASKLPAILVDISKYYQDFRDQLMKERGDSSIFINTEGMKLDIFMFMVGLGLADYNHTPLRKEEYLDDLLYFLKRRISTRYYFESTNDTDEVITWLQDDLERDKQAIDTFIPNSCMEMLHKCFDYVYKHAIDVFKKDKLIFLMPVAFKGSLVDSPLNTALIGATYSVQVLCTAHVDDLQTYINKKSE